MLKNKKRIINCLFPVVWAAGIFILSAIPGEDYPATAFDYAYFAHVLEFFVLAWLVLRVFKPNLKGVLLTLTLCFVFSLSDEIHQIFVPNRSAELIDWLVDCLGIIVGIKFYLYRLSSKLHTK